METIRARDYPAYCKKRGQGRRRQTVGPAAEQSKTRKGRPRFARSAPEERTVEGHTFASKAEAEFYAGLLLDQHAARAKGWTYWIALHPAFLLGGAIYRPDFVVYQCDGTRPRFSISVFEVKGKFSGKFRAQALREFRRNQRQMKALHGIDVELVET